MAISVVPIVASHGSSHAVLAPSLPDNSCHEQQQMARALSLLYSLEVMPGSQ